MSDQSVPFETRLLRRVADAVEAGEVSADLLTDLQTEIAVARARPPEERHARALVELAERLGLPLERLTAMLAALDAQPTVTREYLLRRFVEAWLVPQRDAYDADHHGGHDDERPRR